MTKMPTRDEAMALFLTHNQQESLLKHALAVEAVLRHFAGLWDEDEEKWGIIGLCHDLDYEKYPEQHCHMTKVMLEEAEWPEDWIRGVMSHGWKLCTDVEPISPMEKAIYAVDELTGLIMAAALMRPSRSLMDLELKSVKKKWKDKAFAAGVRRDIIQEGADMLDMPLDDMINETIMGLRKAAGSLGLAGDSG
ncbi:MAG: hydrolase [Peptococcaceae bacterium]|jgi:predicted hydrolase (HD superfamily)|nr:hydrolase [Peptococcaceae bacterium]